MSWYNFLDCHIDSIQGWYQQISTVYADFCGYYIRKIISPITIWIQYWLIIWRKKYGSANKIFTSFHHSTVCQSIITNIWNHIKYTLWLIIASVVACCCWESILFKAIWALLKTFQRTYNTQFWINSRDRNRHSPGKSSQHSYGVLTDSRCNS